MSARGYLSIDPEVKAALAGGRPVVALESTIITHGMPYPQNLEMAQSVEAVVRKGVMRCSVPVRMLPSRIRTA